MAGIVCDDLDCIMFEGSILSEVWCEGRLLYQYDSTAPALTVTAPTGTASGSPTYITSGSAYRVQGTATDADSGVAAVYVNGSPAVISGNNWYKDITVAANTTVTVQVYAVDKAGNQTAVVTRYVRYDSAAPSLAVTTPAGNVYTSGSSYTVSGTASDASGLKSLTVNGAAASVAANGTWSRAVALSANTWNSITVVATDKAGRTATVSRSIYYDATAPSLAVSAPAGTSASAPTYLQSDAAMNYTVSGTASDATGIRSVTVNGTAASVSGSSWSRTLSLATNTTHTITVVATDGVGRTTTVSRYVRVEAYYQYAARVAGTSVQGSLDATLRNSAVCAAIAGNATAYGILKSYYAGTMRSYIVNYFSAGLNTLNRICGLDYYVFKSGFDLTGITGWGWSKNDWGSNPSVTINATQLYIVGGGGSVGIHRLGCESAINLTGYSSAQFYGRSSAYDTIIGVSRYKHNDSAIAKMTNMDEYRPMFACRSDFTSTGVFQSVSINIASLSAGSYIVFSAKNSQYMDIREILLKN